jgi:hypothetical protein
MKGKFQGFKSSNACGVQKFNAFGNQKFNAFGVQGSDACGVQMFLCSIILLFKGLNTFGVQGSMLAEFQCSFVL